MGDFSVAALNARYVNHASRAPSTSLAVFRRQRLKASSYPCDRSDALEYHQFPAAKAVRIPILLRVIVAPCYRDGQMMLTDA